MRITFLSTIVVCLAAAGCDTAPTIGSAPSYSSSILAGTWIGTADGVTFTLTVGAMRCEDGNCTQNVPGRYVRISTGATGAFGADLSAIIDGSSATQVVMDFESGTSLGSQVSYGQAFNGALVGTAHIDGAIRVTGSGAPPSPFAMPDSTPITFLRQ
jgi:hypothetical protein